MEDTFPLNSDHFRNNVGDELSLDCDRKFLECLKLVSERLINRGKSTNENLEVIASRIDKVGVSIENVTNKLAILSHVKFVENRVYEDENLEIRDYNKQDNATEYNPMKTLEMIFTRSMKIFNKYEKVEVDLVDLDLEDRQIKNIIFRPKNKFLNFPIPHLIGSKKWKEESRIGLSDAVKKDDSFTSGIIVQNYEPPELKSVANNNENQENSEFSTSKYFEYNPPMNMDSNVEEIKKSGLLFNVDEVSQKPVDQSVRSCEKKTVVDISYCTNDLKVGESKTDKNDDLDTQKEIKKSFSNEFREVKAVNLFSDDDHTKTFEELLHNDFQDKDRNAGKNNVDEMKIKKGLFDDVEDDFAFEILSPKPNFDQSKDTDSFKKLFNTEKEKTEVLNFSDDSFNDDFENIFSAPKKRMNNRKTIIEDIFSENSDRENESKYVQNDEDIFANKSTVNEIVDKKMDIFNPPEYFISDEEISTKTDSIKHNQNIFADSPPNFSNEDIFEKSEKSMKHDQNIFADSPPDFFNEDIFKKSETSIKHDQNIFADSPPNFSNEDIFEKSEKSMKHDQNIFADSPPDFFNEDILKKSETSIKHDQNIFADSPPNFFNEDIFEKIRTSNKSIKCNDSKLDFDEILKDKKKTELTNTSQDKFSKHSIDFDFDKIFGIKQQTQLTKTSQDILSKQNLDFRFLKEHLDEKPELLQSLNKHRPKMSNKRPPTRNKRIQK